MKRLLFTLLATTTLSLAMPAQAGFDEGRAAYEQGDYATALKELRPLAEQGHAEAQFNLGLMYYNGQGVPKDDAKAVKWYRKAAEQGNADAQNNLGVMYVKGQGVPQDYKEAVKWYRKAAEQGYALAQNNLGWMYYNGKGVPQDYKEAAKWHHKAAEQGGAVVQNNLGVMYELGIGLPKDKVLAYALYNHAAAIDPSENNNARKNRDRIAWDLSRDELIEAQALTRELMKPGNFAKALDAWLAKRVKSDKAEKR
jgi:TPR repeat protein